MLSQELGLNTLVRGPYPNLNSEIVRHRAWVEIDREAIAHNVRQIRRLLSPQTGLMAVVKADAYGHGAIAAAETALAAGAN